MGLPRGSALRDTRGRRVAARGRDESPRTRRRTSRRDVPSDPSRATDRFDLGGRLRLTTVVSNLPRYISTTEHPTTEHLESSKQRAELGDASPARSPIGAAWPLGPRFHDRHPFVDPVARPVGIRVRAPDGYFPELAPPDAVDVGEGSGDGRRTTSRGAVDPVTRRSRQPGAPPCPSSYHSWRPAPRGARRIRLTASARSALAVPDPGSSWPSRVVVGAASRRGGAPRRPGRSLPPGPRVATSARTAGSGRSSARTRRRSHGGTNGRRRRRSRTGRGGTGR